MKQLNVKYNKKINKIYFFFFKHITKFILISIFIMLSIITASVYKHYSKKREIQCAAILYEKLIDDISYKKSNFLHLINSFIINNNNNYSFLAILNLSKYLTENNQFEKSEKLLKISLTKIDDVILKNLLNFKLAKIQLYEKKFDDVIYTLNTIKNKEWVIMKNNILGDAYLGKGDKNSASKVWNEAISHNPSPFLRDIILIKISNLS